MVFLTDLDGTKRSLAEWAKIVGQSRFSLHARRKRGWTDADVIHGSNPTHQFNRKTEIAPWPIENAREWEHSYRRQARTVAPGYSRRETRIEFLHRIADFNYHAIKSALEWSVDRYDYPAPVHDAQFARLDAWQQVLRQACHLRHAVRSTR